MSKFEAPCLCTMSLDHGFRPRPFSLFAFLAFLAIPLRNRIVNDLSCPAVGSTLMGFSFFQFELYKISFSLTFFPWVLIIFGSAITICFISSYFSFLFPLLISPFIRFFLPFPKLFYLFSLRHLSCSLAYNLYDEESSFFKISHVSPNASDMPTRLIFLRLYSIPAVASYSPITPLCSRSTSTLCMFANVQSSSEMRVGTGIRWYRAYSSTLLFGSATLWWIK